MKKGIIGVAVLGMLSFTSLFAAPVFTTVTYHPEGIGSYDEWNAVGGDKITAVNNNDGDDTYITATNAHKAQTFTFSTPVLPANAVIDTISLYVFAKKADLGYEDTPILEENNPKFKFRVDSAHGVNDGDENTISNNEGYILYGRHMGINPFTGVTWTLADLTDAATHFGIIRTNEGSETGIEPRVTKFWMDVLYSVADGGSESNEGNGGGTDKFCPVVSAMTLTPSTLTATPSQHVDFNGRNFAIEEDIIVYLDGTQVANARADGGGNFTTGSITLPSVPGTYTYSFVGVNCTTPMTSVITVTGDGTGGNGGNGGGNNGGGNGTTPTGPGTATFATTTPELVLVTFTASSTNAISTFTLSTSSPSGAAVDPVTGVFTWTPTEAQGPGVYTFDIIASSTGGVVTTTVTITVTEVNVAPTASDVIASTLVNIPVTITLLGADSDIPAQALIYTLLTFPTNGTTTASGTTVLYTPNSGFIGQDTFTYVVSDGIATSSIATTTINVMAIGGGGSGGSGGGSGSTGGTTSSGGGSSGGGSGYFVGNGPTGQVLGASTGGSGAGNGQVLGASTCGLYLDKYLRIGYNNDVVNVKKLQMFLNDNLGLATPVTGYYGPITERAVHQLQSKYKTMMLTPWNIDESTGIVYLTTVTAINNIVCPELNLPIPTNLIPFSLNPNVPSRLTTLSALGVSMSTAPVME